MNLEHWIKRIRENRKNLRDEKKTIIFLKYHFYLLAQKRKKLKLGKIVFEIKEYKLDEMPAYKEEVTIRYVRQDTLDDEELKLENRLKALNWKWDFSHISAFLIITFFAIGLTYVYSYWWYCDNFPAFAFKPIKHLHLVKEAMNTLNTPTIIKIGILDYLKYKNIWLINLLTKLAIKLDVLL